MSHNRNSATYTTYLFQGFKHAQKVNLIEGNDIYEQHANTHGGEVGSVMDLFYCADMITHYIKRLEADDQNLWDSSPGVMEYEVVSDLGGWLFDNPDAFDENPGQLCVWETHMQAAIDKWFNPPVANATQPESESTMKLSDLISKLEAIQSAQDNDLDVLTRGSEPQKMVDVSDVRVVTTSKRTAVFIGKPKNA